MNNDLLLSHFLKKTNTYQQESANITIAALEKSADETIQSEEKNDMLSFRDEILNFIKNSINAQRYNAFFHQSLECKKIQDDCIHFSVPTNFIKKIITEQYSDLMANSIEFVLGKSYPYEISVLQKKAMPANGESAQSIQSETPAIKVGQKKNVKDITFTLNDEMEQECENVSNQSMLKQSDFNSLQFDQKKTFQTFIVGPSNNLAHASAIAVSREPGKAYPVLYFYGHSGLGKTHLLHAIANSIAKNHPRLNVLLVSGNELISQIINAYTQKQVPALMDYYTKQIDVLMIDDIHELKDRTGPQNQFFQIFNELLNAKKQIVITSDKDPKDITGIEERVRTRLSSSLTIEIQQPDLETRIAILKKKALAEDIFIPEDVVKLIARCIRNNVRELEGSLVKLAAWSSVYKTDIDIEVAKELLKISEADQEKTITIETISKTVSNYYKISVADLKSKVRNKDITTARHVAMYLSYFIGKATLTEIGFFYGRRDHTTVMHAVNKIKNNLKSDQTLTNTLYEIETLL